MIDWVMIPFIGCMFLARLACAAAMDVCLMCYQSFSEEDSGTQLPECGDDFGSTSELP